MFVKFGGARLGLGMIPRVIRRLRCLRRGVDHEGEVHVTKKWDKSAALQILEQVPKGHGRVEAIVTDGLCAPNGNGLRLNGPHPRKTYSSRTGFACARSLGFRPRLPRPWDRGFAGQQTLPPPQA